MAARSLVPAPYPRALLQPLGLSHVETVAVMRIAASTADDCKVQWALATDHDVPDVYVAHLRSVDLLDDNQESTSILNLERYPPRVAVDGDGRHMDRPVCLIGSNENTHLAWEASTPAAIEELHDALRDTADHLVRQRSLYALARAAWACKREWKANRFAMRAPDGSLLAFIDPARATVAWRPRAGHQAFEQGQLEVAALGTEVEAADLPLLPFGAILWVLALRCDEDFVMELLPDRVLRSPLRRHPLPSEGVDFDGYAMGLWNALAEGPLTLEQLGEQLPGTSDPHLYRSLACLVVSRAVEAVPAGPWTAWWLALQRRLFIAR